jgi:hypothetical protein
MSAKKKSNGNDTKDYIDLCDEVDEKLAQAASLAFTMCGDGGETFRRHSEQVQDEVCWLLARTLDAERKANERATQLYHQNRNKEQTPTGTQTA